MRSSILSGLLACAYGPARARSSLTIYDVADAGLASTSAMFGGLLQ